jgi:hypothetical protein
MVPIEITAFALLSLCVILLAVVVAVQLLPRPVLAPARAVMFLAMVVVVILALYVWVTTRMP